MSRAELADNLLAFNSNYFKNDIFLGMSSVDYHCKKNKESTNNTKIEAQGINVTLPKSDISNYVRDIALLKHCGIKNFRFALSWSLIIPDGTGECDQDAIAFYNEVLDLCIENNIVAFVSIFDSILPPLLEKNGGWSNREMLLWFENYVCTCVNSFANKVNHWVIFNDSAVFTNAAQFLKLNSVVKNNVSVFLSALHHTLLCQSLAFKKIKEIKKESQVGTFLTFNYAIPLTFSEKDLKAAERTDAILNRIFIEPSLGLGYPIKTLPFLKSISKYSLPGDDELIKVDFDFIGLQNCSREVVKHNLFIPYLNAQILQYDKLRVKKEHFSNSIYNELLYKIIRKYSYYNSIKKLYINQPLSFYNVPNTKQIDIGITEDNIDYSFAQQIILANQSGGNVNGYFVTI